MAFGVGYGGVGSEFRDWKCLLRQPRGKLTKEDVIDWLSLSRFRRAWESMDHKSLMKKRIERVKQECSIVPNFPSSCDDGLQKETTTEYILYISFCHE